MTCMAEGIHELMTGGCQKKPCEKMCQWIDEVWHDNPREMVAKSFLKCCIKNSIDRFKDYFVFESSDDESFIVAEYLLVTELFGDTDSESDFKVPLL